MQYHGPSLAGLLEVIKILAAAGLDLNEPLNAEKNTLLHLAAGKSVEATQFLLECGALQIALQASYPE